MFCEPWIWAAKDAEVVQLFGVSRASIKRYLKLRREEGHVRPKAIPGRPPKKRAQVEVDVLPQLQAHDDATLEQTHGERARLANARLSILYIQEHLHLLSRSSGWSVCFPAWVRSGSAVDQRVGLLLMTMLVALS